MGNPVRLPDVSDIHGGRFLSVQLIIFEGEYQSNNIYPKYKRRILLVEFCVERALIRRCSSVIFDIGSRERSELDRITDPGNPAGTPFNRKLGISPRNRPQIS